MPFSVPGKIEAEQYDLGMPGTTYYDTTKGILPVGFGDPMMLIFSRNNQHQVIQMEPEEWLEYSINVSETGFYQIDITYAALRMGRYAF